jgi:gamma-glutamyltranspeptidase/glutathione hydrolase
MLRRAGFGLGALALQPRTNFAQNATQEASHTTGAIIGEPTAARWGQEVLDTGGSAIDAILTAALVAAVVSPHNCGIGGYGGHMIIARADQKKVRVIDFNTIAPRRARPDMFAPDASGRIAGRVNERGWLASGVPGVIAGIELAARKFATRRFSALLAAAIELTAEGFIVGKKLASIIRANAPGLRNDPATASLYMPKGEPPGDDDIFRNPDLAKVLQTLAKENSVEPFYRGEIAQRIGDAFAQSGGLVDADDLGAYEAREVDPFTLALEPFTIHTAPLTAGGMTALETSQILRQVEWKKMEPLHQTHARVEALRIAWNDRLRLFGDPDFVSVPIEKLLSPDYAMEQAGRIRAAVEAKTKIAQAAPTFSEDHGTVNLSCCDRAGNFAALTLTHGDSFGAQVTVPGLGLTLGHGMSRFEVRPGLPNSVAPRKRPLHNMCPTVVARDGRVILAIGGAGGRKIPNAVFDVLFGFIQQNLSAREALEAPRCHSIGNNEVALEARWREEEAEYLKSIGFEIRRAQSAFVSLAQLDSKSEGCAAFAR